MITADGLERRFDSLDAVKGVSFAVAEGEVFGFLGPNGAGKTTTINMLCTLLRPTSGTGTINGFDIARQRSDVRRSIGLVFQQTTLDESLTAEQNLRFHAYAYAVPRDVREDRTRSLLEMVELWDRRGTAVRNFSGGMKRRLEIARGLLHHPRVLFLDEPTLGLDPQTRRRIWDYLMDLREREGLTIFLTTHYMDEAENADRIAIIDHGAIVAMDTPAGLKSLVGGDLITLGTPQKQAAVTELRQRYSIEAAAGPSTRSDGSPDREGQEGQEGQGAGAAEDPGAVSFQVPDGGTFLPELLRSLSVPVTSVGLRPPTLDDVFLHLTGREIRDEEVSEKDQMVASFGRGRHP